MSRLKNFSRNLVTSYLQLGVNVVYSLVSIPLILHWLPKAEFGLWALLVQLMGYVSLIDLGMTSALARLLVDYKDKRSDGGYGSFVKTAFLVSLIQGLIIIAVVALASPLLASLMKIPPEYTATFVFLMRLQGVIAAFNYFIRPLGLMLYAHQRMDLQAYNEIVILMASLGLLILFLASGCGIFSFIYANAISALISPCNLSWQCYRLRILPVAAEWGAASWKVFKEVFSYGKDIFLFNLGLQLQMASQTIVVSRAFGLEQAAVWSIGSKAFSLMVPLMCRPYGASLPGLFEMITRGEIDRLKNRYRSIVLLTASLGAFLGSSFVLCNSLFVHVWTAGKITWSPLNDVLLGAWLFILSMQTTHSCFVSVTKQIGGMRYIFFAEGVSFLVLSMLIGCRWGVPGMVATSILCTLVFTYQYGLRRSRDYFHLTLKELAVDWVRPSLKLAGIYVVLVPLVWLATPMLPVIWRLAVHASVALTVGGILFLRVGFPMEMIHEAGRRLPQPAGRLLLWLVPCKS